MRIDPTPPRGPENRVGGLSYDEIYKQSWDACLDQCKKKLEKGEKERAEAVKSLDDFRKELENLKIEYEDDNTKQAIMLLMPALNHYEGFAQNFVKMMAKPVDVSMMWGLLFLVFLLALEHENILSRITKMLKKICDKLHAVNDATDAIEDFSRVKADAVEVNRELVILWLNIIMVFRTVQLQTGAVEELALQDINNLYGEAFQNISEAVVRIEKVADHIERQARKLDMELFQKLLSLKDIADGTGDTPCHTLPVAQNKRFFGREKTLKAIDDHLKPSDTSSGMSSLAIYGLGGVGKTQTALAYAYSKVDELDAVFWIYAATNLAVKQAVSQIAVHALKLPQADMQAANQNTVLVLDWLQKTDKKWLIVFDNVESHSIFNDFWPVARHGAILVTTRNATLAAQPIDSGLPIEQFTKAEGADFLLHQMPKCKNNDHNKSLATQLAGKLGCLPLAMSQMAALMNARNMSIDKFLAMYEKHAYRLHRKKEAGSTYLGYEHTLDTVWDISFSNLTSQAAACLGVLTLVAPDAVPVTLFEVNESGEEQEEAFLNVPDEMPSSMSFIMNDLDRDDALEELRVHGLVRSNASGQLLFVHPLVQTEFMHRMDDPQDKFDAAVYLLLHKFPSRTEVLQNDELWVVAERYLQHVLKLSKDFEDSQGTKTPFRATENFCRLLAKATWYVHDNDTLGIFGNLLELAISVYKSLESPETHEQIYTFLLQLSGLRRLLFSEFVMGEKEMRECLDILPRILPEGDGQFADTYMYLAMCVGSLGRYEEGTRYFEAAKKVLDGPAGSIPTRVLVWDLNTSRNFYCQGEYDKAETLLKDALSKSEEHQGWYYLTYSNVALTSLYCRKKDYAMARTHVETARAVIERSGTIARFSWQSGLCSYYESLVATLQNRIEDATQHAERAVGIGKLCKVPPGIQARATHQYSKTLGLSGDQQESERQRKEAQRLRTLLPDGSTDLDDESDEAYQKIVKMDQR